jgi:hypothetical protein
MTIQQTLPEAAEQLEAVAAVTDDAVAVIEEVVADKGYHSRTTVHDLETLEIRTYISDPIADHSRGSINRRNATPSMPIDVASAVTAGNDSFGNGANCSSDRVHTSMRRVACGARTCGGTRTCSSGCSCPPGAFNLGLWMRSLFGIGTPRGLQGRVAALTAVFSALWTFMYAAIAPIRSQTRRPTSSMPRPDAFAGCE